MAVDDHADTEETLEDTYLKLASEVAQLVAKKQRSYGNSIEGAGRVLAVLYPTGITPEHYVDALLLARIIDKLFRLAGDKWAFGENPYLDLVGYGMRGAALKKGG